MPAGTAAGAFGGTKEDSRFRRFMTRGKAGVRGELFLLCFGYKVNKLHHAPQDTTGAVR
jgi:hypothetical protein